VVELKGFGHFQHPVPVSLVQASVAHCVSLRRTLAELANTEFFATTEAVPVDASTAWMMADEMMSWPLAFLSSRRYYSSTSGSRPVGLRCIVTPPSKPPMGKSVMWWRSFCRIPTTASRM
jgi:hypothetical protein